MHPSNGLVAGVRVVFFLRSLPGDCLAKNHRHQKALLSDVGLAAALWIYNAALSYIS